MLSVSKPRRTSSPLTCFLSVNSLLCRADCFGYEHRIHYAAVIKVLPADLVPGCDLALAFVDHVFEDVLNCRKDLIDATEIKRRVAFGELAGGTTSSSPPAHHTPTSQTLGNLTASPSVTETWPWPFTCLRAQG